MRHRHTTTQSTSHHTHHHFSPHFTSAATACIFHIATHYNYASPFRITNISANHMLETRQKTMYHISHHTSFNITFETVHSASHQFTYNITHHTAFHTTPQHITCHWGAGIAQWLERRTRDRKVPGSSPRRSGGRMFFSMVDFKCWLL